MRWFVFLLLMRAGGPLFAADESYDGGFQPARPASFPAEFNDYQILPRSVSPDQQYAFIYPKRAVLYEQPGIKLCFVALKPFRVLNELPSRNSLARNARGYYEVNWAQDSSAAVFVAGTKWGPDKVFLTTIQAGRVANVVDLTAEVRKQVQADFEKSKTERYNWYYDFIFETTADSRWELNDQRQVIIDCICTTDPKQLNPKAWRVKFSGIWNIAEGRFYRKTVNPIKRTNPAR